MSGPYRDTTHDIHAFLRSTEIFSGLDEEEIEAVARGSAVRQLEPEEHVFRRGDGAHSLYVILAGTVAILRSDESKQSEIARYVTGEVFGEINFFMEAPRSADARAEEATTLLVFPGENRSFAEFLSGHPRASARLLQRLIGVVSNRIRNTNRLISERSPWVQELRNQVLGDTLTGLYNRKYLDDELPSILRSSEGSTALFMIKPDDFKAINDTYGHEVGDEVLRLLAAAVNDLSEPEEPVVRFRGNEIALVAPGCERQAVLPRAEAIREEMNRLDIRHLVGEPSVRLTFSVGVALCPEHATTAEVLTDLSHRALFRARELGLNRCCTADEVIREGAS